MSGKGELWSLILLHQLSDLGQISWSPQALVSSILLLGWQNSPMTSKYKKLYIFQKSPITCILLVSAGDLTFLFFSVSFFSDIPQRSHYLKMSYFPQFPFPNSPVTFASCIPLFPHIFNFSFYYWLFPFAYEHALLVQLKTSIPQADLSHLSSELIPSSIHISRSFGSVSPILSLRAF